jgi:outer membrane protein OmpA-like peptidoglycan-associated protein
MDSQADPVPPTGPPQSLVVERHRVRRPLGRLFWLAAIGTTTALVLLTTMVARAGVEDALGKAASDHLQDVGIKGVAVEVDGLNVVAKVPSGRDPGQVEDELATVAGVGLVTAEEVFRSKAEERACTNLQKNLDRATGRQRIQFVGTTSRLTPAGTAMLGEVAKLLKACPGAVVIVGGHSDSHTTDFSTISLVRARLMTQRLKQLGIKSERLVPRGYGDEFPIAEGDSAAAQLRNQRGSIAVQGD